VLIIVKADLTDLVEKKVNPMVEIIMAILVITVPITIVGTVVVLRDKFRDRR
jgi:hypothetical protein